jgi:pyruvate dehydrogenase E2 component (dihydrolipoyllysine-residue acetyltransferase)
VTKDKPIMAEFAMPKLGADMTAGKLVAWYKKPGDPVIRGDVIAEVETDKGDIDVEIFVTGVIEKLLVPPGETVLVGTPLALIKESQTVAPEIAVTPSGVAPPVSERKASPDAELPVVMSTVPTSRLVISPSARKLARELGVEPASVKGTGPGGAITREDIQHAAASKRERTEPPAGLVESASSSQSVRVARMRQAIAAAMSRSKREIPHYYLSTTVDMHTAMAWLAEENAKRSVPDRLLYGVLLLKAVALALRDFPELNGFWSDDKFAPSEAIHVGVAISLRQGGLIAPALQHADRQSLDQLMKNFLNLVQRARSGALRGSEVSDPTITVTSLGEQGVESVFGVIYPPQVALVGFGMIVQRPWVVGDKIVTRPVISASLSGDHRVSDGHRGGRFLATVNRLLQEPGKL